jgi:Tol biopolymer transport system component
LVGIGCCYVEIFSGNGTKELVSMKKLGLLLAVALTWSAAPAQAMNSMSGSNVGISRVSLQSSGAQANFASRDASISVNGRFVAFSANATNLVSGDTNGTSDVFVHDAKGGKTERVSVSSTGAQPNGNSRMPSISGDGRYVAFSSDATNLVPDDTNGVTDVFVHDRRSGTTKRVSVSSSRAQANRDSISPSISADGRSVAFESNAFNLVRGDTNGATDVFVHDRRTEITQRVSVSSSGAQANMASFRPSITANGRSVAFMSYATNLVGGDTNGVTDIFLHDQRTGTTELVSVSSSGVRANGGSSRSNSGPSISADGRYVAFESDASNLVSRDTNAASDVFVHDRRAGTTKRVSASSNGAQANGDSTLPSTSRDGRSIAFWSFATNLVPGDTNDAPDIFVRHLS